MPIEALVVYIVASYPLLYLVLRLVGSVDPCEKEVAASLLVVAPISLPLVLWIILLAFLEELAGKCLDRTGEEK